MDNIEEITDELVGLPGFVRRNLLLMRDLDLKSSAMLDEAKRRDKILFESHTGDTVKDKSKSTPKTLKPGSTRSEVQNSVQERMGESNKRDFTSSESEAFGKESNTINYMDFDSIHGEEGNGKKSSQEFNNEADSIQDLRIQGIHILQEKLAVNNQIACVLKHEYDRLKSTFDAIYRDMESNGQMTAELRMYFTSSKTKHQSSIDSVLLATEKEITSHNTDENRSIAQHQNEIAKMFKTANANAQNKWESESKITEGGTTCEVEQKGHDPTVDKANSNISRTVSSNPSVRTERLSVSPTRKADGSSCNSAG